MSVRKTTPIKPCYTSEHPNNNILKWRYLEGKLHRKCSPAKNYLNFSHPLSRQETWYLNGIMHRYGITQPASDITRMVLPFYGSMKMVILYTNAGCNKAKKHR